MRADRRRNMDYADFQRRCICKPLVKQRMAYGTAWPLSEDDFLCVYDRHAANRGIYWIDRCGSEEDFHRVTLWLDCNSEFFGAYHDTEAQARGSVVTPQLD